MITGGTISYENGVKSAEDYAPAKKARVELRFDVAEGSNEDEVILIVYQKCIEKVEEMLSGKPATVSVPRTVGRPRKTAPVSATPAATTEDKPAAPEQKVNDPAAIEDDLDDILPVFAPAPVSDAELNSAIQAKNREIQSAVRIKAVLGRYNGGPGHVVADIPQERRHKFLKELAALQVES